MTPSVSRTPHCASTSSPAIWADAAAVLAFAYSLAAARDGQPSHNPAGSRLAGADLTGWRIDGTDHQLGLRGLSLTGANLTDAVLREVDLSGADLSGADLTRAQVHNSDLSNADLRRTNLTGTVFRHCNLTGAQWSGSTAYQTQALRCHPAQDQRQGWLVAPASTTRPSAARMSARTGQLPDSELAGRKLNQLIHSRVRSGGASASPGQ